MRFAQSETLQAGSGEQDRVELAFVELLQPRADVAAQRLHRQMRVARAQLGFAAQAGGADHAAGRQIGQAFVLVRDEGVARVLALADHRQLESRRQFHRHVLHRMHGQIGLSRLQRHLELLDKQALAADFGQRDIENLVAARGHAQNAHRAAGMQRAQAISDMLRLPHGEGTFTGGDGQDMHGGRIDCLIWQMMTRH